MTDNSEAIHISNVQVQYKQSEKPTLNIEQLLISQGERIALVGSSGSGKTTLLRLINGYLRPKSGSLHILGEEMTARRARRRDLRRRVAFVFQSFNLVERASVFENVLWGRLGYVGTLASIVGGFTEEDKQTALSVIQEVDLLDQIEQRCDTLSGGQQQRVGIARALAQEPDIILADEPVSSLDPSLADDVLQLLLNVSVARSATLLMSLHQPDFARQYAQRIIGLQTGQIVFDGKSEDLTDAEVKRIYGQESATMSEIV